jgi:hypothetical protein
MTSQDLAYVRKIMELRNFVSPVLELGAGYGGNTCSELCQAAGYEYFATDLYNAPGVDFVANFETGTGVEQIAKSGPFSVVLVLNVIEHVFNPISVLANAVRVTALGGLVVVITPVIWPIHNYPSDYCRLLPDWYREFAAKNGLFLDEGNFWYVGIGPVSAYRTADGQNSFPPAASLKPFYRFYSRGVHKIFNSFGRGMFFPSTVSIGVTFTKLKTYSLFE